MCDVAMAQALMKDAEKEAQKNKDQNTGASTDVDTGQKDYCCASKEVLDAVFLNHEEEKKNLLEKLNYWHGCYTDVKRSLQEVQKKSENITSQMANIIDTQSDLEADTEFANIKLGKKFEQLYVTEWCNLSEWLDENIDITELGRIKAITSVLKKAYDTCEEIAEEQIRQFLFLDREEELPDHMKEPSLYKERRTLGQQEKVRKQVQKRVIDKVVTEDLHEYFEQISEKEKLPELKSQMKQFLEKYIDFCWLFIISHPRVYLDFEVLDKKFSDIKERFKTYSCQDKVVDETKEKDSVYCVVWPSLIYKDASAIIMKGDVVIVN